MLFRSSEAHLRHLLSKLRRNFQPFLFGPGVPKNRPNEKICTKSLTVYDFMPDEVIGISVLGEMEPLKEVLFVQCYSPERHFIDQCAIMMVQKGHGTRHSGAVWTYELVDGGTAMVVSPSFHRMTGDGQNTLFHNSGKWTTKFVRRKPEEARDAADEMNRELRDRMREQWIVKIA